MIIKGQARGRSQQLAAHLLRADQNEDIRLHELRSVTAAELPGALAEMEALAAAVPSKRPLYHASISPEAHTPLTPDQIRIAADTLERKLGLGGQPRAVVVHRKKDREHLHVVWSRIDLNRGKVISDSWNYRAHEEAARELEVAFGHRVVQGSHVARGFSPRPRRAPKDYEYRQAERSGTSPAQVTAELMALWQGSGRTPSFRKKLEEAGYVLARGDRRVFVVVDRAGNVHSLARRLGLRSRDLAGQLGNVHLDELPSVAEARGATIRMRANPQRLRFQAAAKEATRPYPVREIRGTRVTRHRDMGAAIAWINMIEHAPERIMRRPPLPRIGKDTRYRSLRAAILAEFAEKVHAALKNMEGEALDAAIARLVAEREAALRALADRSHLPTFERNASLCRTSTTVRRVGRYRRRSTRNLKGK